MNPDREASGHAARGAASCDVTIVTVNYKVAPLVGLMIGSVPAAAGDKTFEIVVVDNASGDGSAEALRQRFPHVELIASPENLGFSRGNNLGARRARGRHLALVNPDVVLSPGSLAHLIEFLDAHPSAGMVGPKVLLPDGQVQSFAAPLPSSWDVLRALPGGTVLEAKLSALRESESVPRRSGLVHGACMVIRGTAWARIGGMPTDTFMYGEENLLGHRLAEAGFEVWYDPRVSVLHEHESSAKQAFLPHSKALQKRWAHILARSKMLPRVSYVAWNAVLASRAAVASAGARLRRSPDASNHWDFARLHAAALTAKSGRPPPSPSSP